MHRQASANVITQFYALRATVQQGELVAHSILHALLICHVQNKPRPRHGERRHGSINKNCGCTAACIVDT